MNIYFLTKGKYGFWDPLKFLLLVLFFKRIFQIFRIVKQKIMKHKMIPNHDYLKIVLKFNKYLFQYQLNIYLQ